MTTIKRALYLKFARRLNRNGQAMPVPSIISENSQVKGNILSSGGIVHVDGKVIGDIICDELVIGLKGTVQGDIQVNNLHLFGTLKGKAAVDNLFVSKTAKLIGEASHNSIAVEPGAYVDGLCLRSTAHKKEDIETEVAPEHKAKAKK